MEKPVKPSTAADDELIARFVSRSHTRPTQGHGAQDWLPCPLNHKICNEKKPDMVSKPNELLLQCFSERQKLS